MARLERAGVRIVAPPKFSEWGRRAVALDPDGNKVELVTPYPDEQP